MVFFLPVQKLIQRKQKTRIIAPPRIMPKLARTVRKKKIVFLCITGRKKISWSDAMVKKFEVFLQNQGLRGLFEVRSAGFLDPNNVVLLSGADIVASPFFSLRGRDELNAFCIKAVKKYSPKAKRYYFSLKPLSSDFVPMFKTIVKRALSQ